MAWARPWTFEFQKLPYNFNLECLADWQLGSRNCCQWKIDQQVDEILERAKHTDSGVVFAGDIEDEDRPSTRQLRRQIGAERMEVVERDAQKHAAWLDRDVLPILMKLHTGTKHGILGGVAGHHWTQITPVVNSVQYLFGELERRTKKPCSYLGEMVSFLDFRFKETRTGWGLRQVGLLQHGEGGGQTKASTVNKMERAAQGFEADFFIRGHDCQLVAIKTDQLYAPESRGTKDASIRCRTKAMLNLGSATMGYEMGRGSPSYIESAMMRPATMGWGTLKFRIRRALLAEDVNQGIRADIRVEI